MSGSSTSATGNSSQVLVGGKILVRMDGKIVGFANSASCTDAYGLNAIHVLGQLHPVDYVPTDARHTINMNVLVMKSGSLIKANLEPTGAGSFGLLSTSASIAGTKFDNTQQDLRSSAYYKTDEGIPGSLRVLHGKNFDIEIIAPDLDSPATKQYVVVKYKNCYYNTGSVSFSANTITVHNCQFLALYREGFLTADTTSFPKDELIDLTKTP